MTDNSGEVQESITKIDRLIHDPFAVLGIFVMVIGFLIAVNGIRHLVRG